MKGSIDFKQVKREVGIRRILDHYGLLPDLSEKGDRLSGSCPICDSESKTAFRVSQEKNCFKCFSCDAGGNILDLVRPMEDCSIREAALKIADWFEIVCGKGRRRPRASRRRSLKPEVSADSESQPSEPSPSKLQEKPPTESPAPQNSIGTPPSPARSDPKESAGTDSPVNAPLSFELKLDPEHPWFEENGLLPETVELFGLGFCSKGMMRGRIAFPIRNREGELIGYAGLWIGEDLPGDQPRWKFPNTLNLHAIVYPAEKLGQQALETMLVATNPLQVVLAWQLGIGRVVFFPGDHPRPAKMRAISIATAV